MSRWSSLALLLLLLATALPVSAQEHPFILDGLVVTASPTPRAAGDVARFVTVLDGDDLRLRGVTDLVTALRDVPGLTVVRGGSYGAAASVFLRGGESDYVQFLVDGDQVNSPGGAFDFSGILLDNVERVEVVRGPASSLYGSDAMAGVIHVITRTGRGGPAGEVSLRAGSYGRREASASMTGGQGPVAWSFGLNRVRWDGVLPTNNGFDNTAVTGNVRLAPDDRTRAGVTLRVAQRTYRFPTDGSGAITDANAFTFGDEVAASVNAARVLTPGLELRGTVSLARNDGGTDDQPDEVGDTLGSFGFTSLDHVQRATADLRANLSRGGWVATAGMEMEDQRQRSFSESLSQWGPSSGRSEYQRGNRAAYAHLTGSRDGGSLALGGRWEDNEQFGRITTWNAEAGWRVAAGVALRAAAGVGVKEPTFYEAFAQGWVRGNPSLSPERSRSVELGGEGTLMGGRATVRATAFTQRFQDLIQYVAAPAEPTDPNFVNVARASARGVEAGVSMDLGAFKAGAEWSWTDTEILDAGFDEGPGADFVEGGTLLRRPAHTLRVDASAALGAASLSGDVRVVGARDDRDFSTWPAVRLTLPRYTTVALGMTLPVRPGFRLGVRGENLLDARYEEVFGFAAPGRSVTVSGTLSLGGT